MHKLDQKGMTLLETIVALGLFSLVIVFTMGLFIGGMKSQSLASEMNLTNNEASFLLERMAREIRMANDVNFTIENNDSKITFTNHDGITVIYCASSAAGTSCQNNGVNLSVKYGTDAMTQINSPNVKIKNLSFFANGNPMAVPPTQKILTVYLELSGVKHTNVSTKLQTSVVPRVY